MSYDFLSLSPDDFQLLVRDLLQAELGIVLETFTAGADLGIDLRHIDDAGRKLIVQCKRYKSFAPLLRTMQREELPKVRRLRPSRYLLATSVPLNPQRKAKLFGALRPFCKSEGDIFGAGDLNNLLDRHPDVLRRNFKLWLTSAVLLDRVLPDGIFGEDEATLERARERLRRYVRNPSLDRASALLESERYCIISGAPGIGKTTLAEILVLNYVTQDFEVVKISRSLDEIRTRRNPRRNLIFYFDDFLGQTLVEQFTRIEDRRLIDFIEDVRRRPNWRLILTTREYVYQQGILKLEALAHAAEHLKKCIITLGDYTSLIRAKILYNHLYYSGLPATYITALVAEQKYMEIVRHRNYNPRIVQYMTMDLFYSDLQPRDYPKEFLANLENPHRIWRHTFHRNISRQAQDLLFVLASFPPEALLQDVSDVFAAFHAHRSAKLHSPMSPRAFEDALQELDGDFIHTTRVASEYVVSFSNPSIRDFLNAILSSGTETVEGIVATARFFEQLSRIWELRSAAIDPLRFIGNDTGFVMKLRELIEGDSPAFRRHYEFNWELSKVTREQPFYSERVLAVLGIAEELQTDAIRKLVQELIGEDEGETPDLEEFGKEALVDILVRLRKNSSWMSASSRLFAMIRAYLLGDLNDVDDFKALGAFVAAFPSEISKSEWRMIEKQLESEYNDWSSDVWSNADQIWSLRAEIEELGQVLKVDIISMLFELQDRAEELERNKETPSPRIESGTVEQRSSDETSEIHALFKSLVRPGVRRS